MIQERLEGQQVNQKDIQQAAAGEDLDRVRAAG